MQMIRVMGGGRQSSIEEPPELVILDVVTVDVVTGVSSEDMLKVDCGEMSPVVKWDTNTCEEAAPPECETPQLGIEKAETTRIQMNVECRVIKGMCQHHKCSAKVLSNSRKEWAWLEHKKMYGWKYRKVKTVIYEGLSLGQPERGKTRFGGSMADQYGQISDSRIKGKVYATKETGTNLSDGDVK